jgi:hypothetical protein
VKSLSKENRLGEASFQLCAGRKALSLSNLAIQGHAESSNLHRMKSFLSSTNLEGIKVTLSKSQAGDDANETDPIVRFDRSSISKLLENVSSEESEEAEAERYFPSAILPK